MKLLILAKNIEGGTGTFLFNFLKIQKLTPELSISTMIIDRPKNFKSKSYNFFFFQMKDYKNDYYTLSLKKIVGTYKQLLWVYHFIKINNPDVVLGVGVHSNILISIAKLLNLKHKYKIILTTHTDLNTTLRSKSSLLTYYVLKGFVKFLYNQADILVGVSKGVSYALKKDFNISKKIITIYNGISTPSNITFKSTKGEKIIISIARLDRQKDFTTLLKAFKLTIEKFPGAKLWILGEGPQRKDIENTIKLLGINNYVFLLGWKKNIQRYLGRSDVFVLSTFREGFPYSILEALAYSKPVIATDVKFGPSEILGNGKYGILIPSRNEKKLSETILALLRYPKKYNYYSRSAIIRAQHFSLEKMLNGYKKIIQSMH